MRLWLSFVSLVFLCFLYICSLSSKLAIKVSPIEDTLEGSFIFQTKSDLEVYKGEEQIAILHDVALQDRNSRNKKEVSLELFPTDYTIYFESIYGRKECVEIDLVPFHDREVAIYLDYVDFSSESWTAFIDRLSDGEGYSIEFGTFGCFGGSNHFMEIWKIDGEIYITGEIDGYKFVEKYLNEDKIQAIRELEHRLHLYQFEGSCSSLDYFTIDYNCEKLEVDDYSCSFDYIPKIISRLTREKEEKST